VILKLLLQERRNLQFFLYSMLRFYRINIDQIWSQDHCKATNDAMGIFPRVCRKVPLFLTPTNFHFVTSFYFCSLIDIAQVTQTQRNGWVLPIHVTVLNLFLNRTNRVPALLKDLYHESKVASRHPNGPVAPLFFPQHNTFPLNRDQRIASYSLSPLSSWSEQCLI
jgi:hypothetical protein